MGRFVVTITGEFDGVEDEDTLESIIDTDAFRMVEMLKDDFQFSVILLDEHLDAFEGASTISQTQGEDK